GAFWDREGSGNVHHRQRGANSRQDRRELSLGRVHSKPLPQTSIGPVKIATLLTDFGTSDAYVAAMKGVLLSWAPTAQIIDISHQIPPQNVKEACRVLESVYRYFPKGAVHVGVVDPEVGTKRKRLIVESQGYLFVGPDNGIFGFTRSISSTHVWSI